MNPTMREHPTLLSCCRHLPDALFLVAIVLLVAYLWRCIA